MKIYDCTCGNKLCSMTLEIYNENGKVGIIVSNSSIRDSVVLDKHQIIDMAVIVNKIFSGKN